MLPAEWKMQVPCNNSPLLVWWTDMCDIIFKCVGKALPCQYICLDLVFPPLSSFKIYYLTDHGRKCVLFHNSRVQCTLQPLFSSFIIIIPPKTYYNTSIQLLEWGRGRERGKCCIKQLSHENKADQAFSFDAWQSTIPLSLLGKDHRASTQGNIPLDRYTGTDGNGDNQRGHLVYPESFSTQQIRTADLCFQTKPSTNHHTLH